MSHTDDYERHRNNGYGNGRGRDDADIESCCTECAIENARLRNELETARAEIWSANIKLQAQEERFEDYELRSIEAVRASEERATGWWKMALELQLQLDSCELRRADKPNVDERMVLLTKGLNVYPKPAYVANGSSGCVFRPSAPCQGKTRTENTISKVFRTKEEADEEKKKHNALMELIDPQGDFTVKLVGDCSVRTDELGPASKCEFKSEKLYQLVFIDGGVDLWGAIYDKKIKFEEIFGNMKTAFIGIAKMCKKEMVHLDIKPGNIVYNTETKKISIIDFGSAQSFNKFMISSGVFPVYAYHPDDFDIFAPSRERCLSSTWLKEISVNRLHYWKFAKFAHLWEILLQITEVFVYSGNTGVKANNYKPDKVDVYGLGATIIELLCAWLETADDNLIREREKLYVDVMKLCLKMLKPYVERISAKDAFLEFKQVERFHYPRR